MRRHGIRALAGRRFRPCATDRRHYLPIAPNWIRLADITYIATGEGWLYLAAVLDLATRKIVGGVQWISGATIFEPNCRWQH